MFEVRVPGWATQATGTVNGAATKVKAGTMWAVGCQAHTTIRLNLNPEIRLEYGWGQNISQVLVPYSPQGASVPSASDDDWALFGGAAVVPSREPGLRDIRSGDPGQHSLAVLDAVLMGEQHYVTEVHLQFQYVCGYSGHQPGPTLRVVLLDGSHSVLQTIYQSPVLDK